MCTETEKQQMITNEYGIHTFSLKLQCKYSEIQNIIEQNECICTGKGKLGLSSYYQITQFKGIGVEIQLGQSVSHPCWLILIVNPSSLLAGTYEPTALFQANEELAADGEIGNVSYKVMQLTTKKFTVLKKGVKSNAVKKMQTYLIKLGYLNSYADGDFGSVTEIAVKKFQKENGLYVDGIAGIQTLVTLYSK